MTNKVGYLIREYIWDCIVESGIEWMIHTPGNTAQNAISQL